MSPEVLTIIVTVIVSILPVIGVHLPNDQIETTIKVIVAIGGGILLWVKSVSQKKQIMGKANVNALGGIKK